MGEKERTASASVAAPRSLESVSLSEEAIWSGRGLDGMSLGLAESSGTVVPSLAMSKRSPPELGPDSAMMRGFECG